MFDRVLCTPLPSVEKTGSSFFDVNEGRYSLTFSQQNVEISDGTVQLFVTFTRREKLVDPFVIRSRRRYAGAMCRLSCDVIIVFERATRSRWASLKSSWSRSFLDTIRESVTPVVADRRWRRAAASNRPRHM